MALRNQHARRILRRADRQASRLEARGREEGLHGGGPARERASADNLSHTRAHRVRNSAPPLLILLLRLTVRRQGKRGKRHCDQPSLLLHLHSILSHKKSATGGTAAILRRR